MTTSEKTPVRYPGAGLVLDIGGEDGNAYMIMGKTAAVLRHLNASEDAIEDYFTEATSGDYDHLLEVTAQWIEFLPLNDPRNK